MLTEWQRTVIRDGWTARLPLAVIAAETRLTIQQVAVSAMDMGLPPRVYTPTLTAIEIAERRAEMTVPLRLPPLPPDLLSS